MATLHISPFSGTWYPQDPAELTALLDQCFVTSQTRTGTHLFRDALAYVVPHASPTYSGTAAAAVYRSLRQQQPQRIVVLAFPHHGGLNGVVAPDIDRVATPLGETLLDADFAHPFPRVQENRLCDHSFEIQLPFLRLAAPKARITPLYVGRMTDTERYQAARRLAALWQPGVIFLASSDFTHYGKTFDYLPFPADDQVAERLSQLDHDCIDAAGSLDARLFLDTVNANGATVCGTAPIALLLETLRLLNAGEIYQHVLDYQTSGEITGEYQHSVSYAALGYYPRAAFQLDDGDCRALVDAAEKTLTILRETGERKPVAAVGSEALTANLGAFVSLHHDDELLGCIGNYSGPRSLCEEIGELTLAAALDDPRFRPAAAEQGRIQVEISVLTPMRRIREVRQFRLGVHGGVLRSGTRTGLLLPQVAEGRSWSVEDFWQALARKTHLPPYSWRDPKSRLEIFQAQLCRGL